MDIEYYYKNKKFKDEGLIIRVTTDSGIIKAICPKNPLAIWAITFGKHLTPVFNLDMTPLMVEYTRNEGKAPVIGQLLYDLSKRRIAKQYSSFSSSGRPRTMKFKDWISTTTSMEFKGKVKII